MPMAFRFAARSDIGLGRYTNNQDSGYAGPHLLAVCDGMGGHAAGDVASSVALGRLVTLDGESHGGDALALLERTLHEANAELSDRVAGDPALQGMGTTATAMVLHGHRISLAHIGDSRCYRWRDGELTRLTHDHTFVQTLVDEGRISEEEAERHPQRSVITRVLTGHPEDEPDLSVRETRVGDRYVVCSDGLTGVVRDETLAELLAEHDDPGACADALVGLALRGGGADNITCVVAHVVDATDTPPSTVPDVVGSAAVRGTVASAAAASPAAKAAALTRAPSVEDDDEPVVAPPPSGRRWALRVLAAALVAAVLGAGGYAAYAWSQQQYYIGADGENVAIYRGLPQDIGPLRMSHVYERQDVTLSQLPEYSAEQVRGSITVEDLGAARDKVAELRTQACATGSGTTGPTSTTSPTSPTSPATPIGPTGTAMSSPSPTAHPLVPGRRHRDRCCDHQPDTEHHGHGRGACVQRLRGGELMSIVTTVVPRTRRGVELVLLVFAVAIVLLAYANVGIAIDGSLPPSLFTYGLGLIVLVGSVHLLLRWRAAYADPVLLPIATVLNGLGLVMIHRLDVAEQRTGGGMAARQLLWMTVGVVLCLAIVWIVRDHRRLQRYTYTALAVGIGPAPAAAAAGDRQEHQRLADLDRHRAAVVPARRDREDHAGAVLRRLPRAGP